MCACLLLALPFLLLSALRLIAISLCRQSVRTQATTNAPASRLSESCKLHASCAHLCGHAAHLSLHFPRCGFWSGRSSQLAQGQPKLGALYDRLLKKSDCFQLSFDS